MAGSSRKSIGLSLALTLMAWGFSSLSQAASPYTSNRFGGVYADAEAACRLILPHVESNWRGNWPATDGRSSAVFSFSSIKKSGFNNPPDYECLYSVSYTLNNTPHNAVIGTGDVVFAMPACVAGEVKTFSWPIGREKTSVGDSSFVPFGNPLPSLMCISGCSSNGPYSASPDTFYGSTDPANPDYQIISANIDAVLTGSTCNVSDNVTPDIPPAPSPDPTDPVDPTDPTDPSDPTDPTDPGGGDGGGGDSGTPVVPPDPVDTSNPDAVTSGDVASLGNRMVDAVYDTANGVIGAINGLGTKVDRMGVKIDGLGDSIDGEPYSEGEGENPGNGEGLGDEAGKSLAEQINDAVDAVVQEREDALDEDIAGLDSMVSGMLGESPDDIGGSILDGLFPSASGCSDFSVSWHSDYPPLILPVCQLTRTKAILEWVFGILAAIYVWRTIMSTLNMSATNAVRNAK